MSRDEWNDDEQGLPAPLPAHERAWRHPSEIGDQAWRQAEPPLAIGRGLTIATGTVGCVLAMAVLWTMLPTQAGRSAVATVRSTIAGRAEIVLTADRPPATTDSPAPTTSAPPAPTGTSPSPTQSTQPQPTIAAPQRTMPTYQLQQVTEPSAGGAVAVAVSGGSLVITTARAVTADLTIELLLPDGSTDTARVLFVDDRSGLAVLVPGGTTSIDSFVVASVIEPGDELTFLGDEQMTITIGDDSALDASWVDDESVREGTPVVNQRGELVALCSHSGGTGRLVPLANLDQLQQAITSYTGEATVWLGIALGDDQSVGLAISAVDPAGPAAAAGLTSGDVILTVDGIALTEHVGLTDLLAAHQPGDAVDVGVRRADGALASFNIVLAQPKTTL